MCSEVERKGNIMSVLEVSYDIGEALAVGPDLDAEFRRMGQLIYHFGSLEADAAGLALGAKADLEQKEAEVYKRVRDGAMKASSKVDKLTEAGIEAMIRLDPEVIRYRHRSIESEVRAKKMRAATWALMAKQKMLDQLGYGHQAQIKAGMDQGVADPRRRSGR